MDMDHNNCAERLPDQYLLAQLALNSTKALETIMIRHEARVYHYILRLVKEPQLAEEITQDVFIKIWENRHALSKLESLQAWFFTISRNRSINILRETASRHLREKAFVEILGQEEHTGPADAETPPDDLLDLMSQFARQLPPKRQEIFLLKAEKGLTNEEIGAFLHISVNTVKNQLRKSYQTLREMMSEHAFLVLTAFLLTLS